MRFIEFNRDDFERKAPVRAYFCNVCMGWHLTSNPDKEKFRGFKSIAEKAADQYIEEKAQKNKVVKKNEEPKSFRGKILYLCSKGEYSNAMSLISSSMNILFSKENVDDQIAELIKITIEAIGKFLEYQRGTGEIFTYSQAKSIRKRLKTSRVLAIHYKVEETESIDKLSEELTSIGHEPRPKKKSIEAKIVELTQEDIEKKAFEQNMLLAKHRIQSAHRLINHLRVQIMWNQDYDARKVFDRIVRLIRLSTPYYEDKEEIRSLIEELEAVNAWYGEVSNSAKRLPQTANI